MNGFDVTFTHVKAELGWREWTSEEKLWKSIEYLGNTCSGYDLFLCENESGGVYLFRGKFNL
jgi:hypothetical protein